jgi:hypothetical protein
MRISKVHGKSEIDEILMLLATRYPMWSCKGLEFTCDERYILTKGLNVVNHTLVMHTAQMPISHLQTMACTLQQRKPFCNICIVALACK